MLTRRGFLKLFFSGVAAIAALGSYCVGIEAMGRPRVTRYAMRPPGWTEGLKLKIVALADFHACDPWMTADRIRAICEQANVLNGDIILLLGDYATGMKHTSLVVDPSEWGAALGVLKAPLGVHAILGNHDYWDDPEFQADPTRKTFSEVALKAAGINVYVNRSIRLEKHGNPFWLAGLGDQLATKFGIDDLPATLSEVTGREPVILMAHEPDIFPEVPERVSLTLSGHTHGGQINIFGWTPVIPSRYGNRYAAGHIQEGSNHLIVSRGLGCTGLPLRFGAWPEILEIELG